jgi:uncharacterized protein
MRSRRWRAALAIIIGTLTFSGALAAQAPAPRGFIWSVERDGRTSWLVGSLHVLPADAHPLPAAMEQAFGRAKTLVEEIDVNDAGSLDMLSALMSKGMLGGGQSLATILPRKTYDKLAQRLASLGMSIELVKSMQPWLVDITLSQLEWQKAGFDANLGVDMYYRGKANEKGIAFRQLETAAEQIDFLANETTAVQVAQLTETLENGDAELTSLREITSAWRAGDASVLERVMVRELKDTPAIYETLLVNRNRRWIPKIESCLAAGNCFIVVGAAHMVGSDGVIAMLRQKGYRITQQ